MCLGPSECQKNWWGHRFGGVNLPPPDGMSKILVGTSLFQGAAPTQLTPFKPEGQIMPNSLLLASPLIFRTAAGAIFGRNNVAPPQFEIGLKLMETSPHDPINSGVPVDRIDMADKFFCHNNHLHYSRNFQILSKKYHFHLKNN